MFGVEAIEVVETSQPDLQPCVRIALTKGCDGHIGFELAVNEWGEATALRFEGETSQDLRTCLKARLTDLVLFPAEDCRGTRIKGKIGGSITWRTDRGTGVSFGHEAGIGCVHCWSRGPSGGPTTGCS
jgi:hypothetical protein